MWIECLWNVHANYFQLGSIRRNIMFARTVIQSPISFGCTKVQLHTWYANYHTRICTLHNAKLWNTASYCGLNNNKHSNRCCLDGMYEYYSSRIVFSHILINLAQIEIAPFDPPTPKTPHRTKHRMIPCGDMAIWNFPKWEVGRRSVLHTFYTDLIYSSSLR